MDESQLLTEGFLEEEDGEEIIEVEESMMTKYLVINIYDLTFVRQIETDIPDDTIHNMDRDELEGTFDLDDNEELFTPNQLRTKITELQRLLDI